MLTFDLYEKNPRYILGFHGCDASILPCLINQPTPTFKASKNDYDWLGSGMYFWENDPHRALQYILEVQTREPTRITKPCVVGAVIDLGHCLNLVENKYIELLKSTYSFYEEFAKESSMEIAQNKPAYQTDHDRLYRNLDCAIIELIHASNKTNHSPEFDSVRGMFIEGGEAYPNSGFHQKTHVQICIRNPKMIKGYFLPIQDHKIIEF